MQFEPLSALCHPLLHLFYEPRLCLPEVRGLVPAGVQGIEIEPIPGRLTPCGSLPLVLQDGTFGWWHWVEFTPGFTVPSLIPPPTSP